jgi:hypothetical protein
MPTPRYTNADLARFQRRPLGVKVEPDVSEDPIPEPNAGPSVEDILRAARGSLTRANRLHDEITPTDADMAATNAMMAGDNPSVFDTPAQKLARMAKNAASTGANVLDYASIPALFYPPTAPAAALWQSGRGAQRIYEGGMERVKQHPILTALDASMAAAPAIKGLRAIAASAEPKLAEVLSAGSEAPRGPFRQPPSSLRVPRQLKEGVPAGELPPVPPERLALPPARVKVNPAAAYAREGFETPVGSVPRANAAAMSADDLAELSKFMGLGPDAGEVAAIRNAVEKDVQRFGGRALPPGPAEPLQLGPGTPNAPNRPPLPTRGKITPRGNSGTPKPPIGKGKQPPNFARNKHAIDLEAALAGPSPALELADEGATSVNASGDSAASLEALKRAGGMKSRGEEFVVYDRAGNARRLHGPDAVDYRARPGETYGILDRSGFRTLEDLGGRVRRLR